MQIYRLNVVLWRPDVAAPYASFSHAITAPALAEAIQQARAWHPVWPIQADAKVLQDADGRIVWSWWALPRSV